MSKHLKRIASPRTWRVAKKTSVWVMKPRPGPHPVRAALPLGVLVRDYLRLADTAREARRIISGAQILVDGRPPRDPKFPVGLQDVISVPGMGQHYRMLLDHKGRLTMASISEADAGWKLCRIVGKATLRKGRRQLNLHDGRNITVKEDPYKTNDVLKLRVPSQEIAGHFKFQPGAPVFITGGSHVGQLAKITSEVHVQASNHNRIVLDGSDEFETIKPYVFVVGDQEATIGLPEEVVA